MDTPEDSNTRQAGIEIDEIRTIDALEARTYSERFISLNPEFTLFRKGISLGIHLIHILGDFPPKDSYDRAQRDLACDTLDSLWLAEHALLRGYENHALSVLRRAYETISLMAYFLNFPDKLPDWERGKAIRQSTIRRELDSAPYPEPRETLDEMYRVYSLFTHVNRQTVYHRMLGDGTRIAPESRITRTDGIEVWPKRCETDSTPEGSWHVFSEKLTKSDWQECSEDDFARKRPGTQGSGLVSL